MVGRIFTAVLAVGAFMATPSPELWAQATSDSGTSSLSGVVVEAQTERPVPAATVTVRQLGVGTSTDRAGRFLFSSPLPRPLVLDITALGYESRSVTVSEAQEGLRIELVRRPIPLDELVISPGQVSALEDVATTAGVTLTRQDMQAIPQMGADVFRTLKRVPGVAAGDISTKLNVRGSPERDLLVRLDGIELFEPYHLKDFDGAFGIVDTEALGGINLITGGFSAEYGDKSAGVFDMTSRRATGDGGQTSVGLSLSSVSVINQGQFDDRRGQWLVAARRGFLEYVLAIGGATDDIDPAYWDTMTRVQYLPNDKSLVWVEGLFAGDALGWHEAQSSSTVTSRWSNGYLWADWRFRPVQALEIESVASWGHVSKKRDGLITSASGGAFKPISASVEDLATADFFGLRHDVRWSLRNDWMVKVGAEVRDIDAHYDYARGTTLLVGAEQGVGVTRTDSIRVDVRPSGRELGTYAALRARHGRYSWEAGLRYDWQQHTGDSDLAPRFMVRVDATDDVAFRGSAGTYFQSQGVHELNAQDGETTFARSQRADQVALGIEWSPPGAIDVRLETYARRVTDPFPVYVNLSRAANPLPEAESDRRLVHPTEARARGLEVIVSGSRTGSATWEASYALAEAMSRVDGQWTPSTLDQRHTLNLRGAIDVGPAWQISAAWHYHTGWPFTEQSFEGEPEVVTVDGRTVFFVPRSFGPLNGQRLPAYHRLDVRATRRFRFERSSFEVFVDVFNLYNRNNLRGYSWNLRRTNDGFVVSRTAGEEQLPFLPTLGFRWMF